MQLEVKTLLNQIQHFVGFVYSDIRLRSPKGKLCLEVSVESHQGRRGECSECRGAAPGYDHLPERWWLFVQVVKDRRQVSHVFQTRQTPFRSNKSKIILNKTGF